SPSFVSTDTAPTEIYTLSLHDALPILEAQKALGWKSTIETELLAGEGYEALLRVRFETVDGAPIQGLAVEGEFWRPVTQGEDRRSEEHTSELQSRENLVCRLLLEKKNE